jgi:predicted nucleic acid-binding protein
MVLVDTSVWIDHFNRTDKPLQLLLHDGEAAVHPFILGELACGNFKKRREIVRLLNDIPCIERVSDEEYYLFLEKKRLYGMGLGFFDIHLLASSVLSECTVYTKDGSLFRAAEALTIAFTV